jgi:hypothetical protein
MKLQKTVIIQEGYDENLSAHYEAPRDKEKLLTIPRSGRYTNTYKCTALIMLVCDRRCLPPLLSKTSVGFFSI